LIDFNVFPSWKRSFDVLFSITMILVTFPFWIIIMALIKIEDGGPVFYRHPRIMESGKTFNCLKFRTMYVDADKRVAEILQNDSSLRKEWEKNYKLKNDPRVTRLGKYLRRTSLDELPQLFNVLVGQMSIVGARPVVPEELEKYYKETALSYCAMKPGLTGPWQVGKRNDIDDYRERVALDHWYALNSSIWLDLKIICKTVLRVVRPKGAY
jgi:lipopolysaccharide/colanic/teichoic acid biosynthesis glycosyltransferase